METIAKLPAMYATNSLLSYEQRLRQKMTPDEAMTGVKRMISAYSEFTPCAPEYLMTLAQTLCQFPYETAMKACSPIHGVPKEFKQYRPSAGQVHEWCERQAQWLYRMAERETPALSAPECNRADRLTLDELRARHGPNWGLTPIAEESPEKRAELDRRINEARDRSLLDEYAARGSEPFYAGDFLVSPSLVEALRRYKTA